MYINSCTSLSLSLALLNYRPEWMLNSIFFRLTYHSCTPLFISKMPVHNSNSKSSARPDVATGILQILLPTTFNSLLCQKGQFTLQPHPRRWFVRKIFCYYLKKVKIENSSFLSVQKGAFQETACPKDGQDRSWLCPWLHDGRSFLSLLQIIPISVVGWWGLCVESII